MRLYATDQVGLTHTLEGETGESVMETIRRAGLPIAAQCGGQCACGTCHIYVADDWLALLPARSDDEEAMLEIVDGVTHQSRLSCQIPGSAHLDGLAVTLGPGTEV